MRFFRFAFWIGFLAQINCKYLVKRSAKPEPTNEDYDRCFDLGDYVPVFEEKIQSFQCYLITSQGPCSEGEWLLLDPEQPDEDATCKKRVCTEENDVLYKVMKNSE